MAEVVWTRNAIANLEAIRLYIAQFNPVAAQRMAVRLKRAAEGLADSPGRGRPVGRQLRELAIVYPYLIRYRVDGDQVFLVRIRHGARQPD